MPYYHYACNTCAKKAKVEPSSDQYDTLVLFETSHSMNPSKAELDEALKCPRCGKTDCERSYKYSQITGYVRGNGYLDKAGVKRDMNLHHLTQGDPYAEYRQPGEVEDLKTRLRRGGQHNPNRRHYDVAKPKTKKQDEKSSES